MLLVLMMVCLLIFYELFIFFLFMSLLPILPLNIPSIQYSLIDLMLLLVSDS
jgi:hypothetical protein